MKPLATITNIGNIVTIIAAAEQDGRGRVKGPEAVTVVASPVAQHAQFKYWAKPLISRLFQWQACLLESESASAVRQVPSRASEAPGPAGSGRRDSEPEH